MKEAHLIFFDKTCPLCQRSVKKILHMDVYGKFLFAPLVGKTANKLLVGPLAHLKQENTLILIENFQKKQKRVWLRGKAIFRIVWILGGLYRLLGILCFVPLGQDIIYSWIAKRRHRLFKKKTDSFSQKHKDRFLP